MITQIFINHGVFDKYAHRLYNRKLNLLLKRYRDIQPQYKEYFFEEMKKDFVKMLDDERYEDFKSCLWKKNKVLFESVIDYDDFSLFNLHLENELYRIENADLIRRNGILEEITDDLTSSNSWKVTKPLRVAGQVKRRISKIGRDPFVLNPKEKLRVLFIASDNNRSSGAFLSMSYLAAKLKNKYGLEPWVILPNEGSGEEILDSLYVKHRTIESKDWVVPLSQAHDDAFKKEVDAKRKINDKAIDKISKFITDNQFDIVHINTTYSYVAAEAALKTDTPFVWHLREFLEEDQSNTLWDRDEGNKLINRADRVIAISNSIFNKYKSVIDSDRLVRIYNGIDAKKFYKPYRNLFSKDKIRFIMVGGFEEYKGQIEFAKACTVLYENGYDNFEVFFVGKGKKAIRQKVEKIFADAGMENVHYLGYREDVENFYAEADISFTCSKSEAFGRTTVEAMLSGCLVIGADSAGTRELIKDGETGMLYKPGDHVDLASRMSHAMSNLEMSKRIAQDGAFYMADNMTSEINADNIYSLYREVLGLDD